MQIRLIYKIIPVPIFYTTSKFWLRGFGAYSYGFFVCLGEVNEGKIAHELQHCKDFYKYGCLPYVLLYYFSRKFRFKFELAGYREELKHGYYGKGWAATQLVNGYDLRISFQEAFYKL